MILRPIWSNLFKIYLKNIPYLALQHFFFVFSIDTTTYSTERSEHFKPCKDKDLAYCLNEGECFVIETLTGSHKHCR